MLNPVPTKRGAVAALSVCALVVGLQSGAGASPAQQARDPLTPRTHFAMKADGSSGAKKVGAGIPNIDSVKSTIRTYYAATDGIADKKKSPYITEINKLLNDQNSYLAQQVHDSAKPAIVLDTDDTTLWTYDMEDGAMHFNFDPKLQDTWVQQQLFPAVPGMVDFVDKAAKLGYTVFGVTGRNDDQKTATLANLTKVGYTQFHRRQVLHQVDRRRHQPAAVLHHLRDGEVHDRRVQGRHPQVHRERLPAAATTSCSTSATSGPTCRAGSPTRCSSCPTRRTTCPARTCPACRSRVSPRARRSRWQPDGSSGATESGEGIPNIDSVKATIRAYYNAPDGIANKKSSRYITEMKATATSGPHA